ncbi:MAG: glycosyltransferase family 39 protein [Planctomycetaceae bacterium]|nr:glycosyltransferase family 39 protein [Planctomycetaceae bacterium]
MTTSLRYSASLRHSALLMVSCLLIFFLNLGTARLFDEDEPKNAECGREMFERGDWLVPTYNYELRTDKPIMLYWLMLSSFETLGVSEFAARLPSALMATLTVFCVYFLGRRLFDAEVGFWGALILASTLMYAMIGRISTPDATLIAFITLSLTIFIHSIPQPLEKEAEETSRPNGYRLPQHWWQFALMYGVMGLAVLTKGPVGFLLPCAVIGLFLMCQHACPRLPAGLNWRQPLRSANEITEYLGAFWAPSRFFSALGAMRPLLLFTVVTAVALPWYIAVGLATDGVWLEGFLGNHNVRRFSSAMEGHNGPFFYYVIAILAGFFPWSVFLPISVFLVARKPEAHARERAGLLFLLVWAGVYFVFFSLARTKLPNYVLPCYPPLALMVSWTLVRWREHRLAIPAWALRWGAISLMAVGLLLGIVFPIVAHLLLPGYALLGLLGLIPCVCGAWLRWGGMESRRPRLLRVMGTCSVLTIVSGLSFAAPWISRAQESAQLGSHAAMHSEPTVPLATYRYFTTNLPFYAQRPVARFHTPLEIEEFLTRHPEGLFCVRVHDWPALLAELPGFDAKEFTILSQNRRFLRADDVLMLRRNGDTPLRAATRPPAETTHR